MVTLSQRAPPFNQRHKLKKLYELYLFPSLSPLAQRHKLNPPERRYVFNLGQPERIAILLVGTGGTGSWAAQSLAQLGLWTRSVGLDLRLIFIDPDTVETRNLTRQNFCAAEVGNPKAFSLAWRYSAAYGLRITPLVERFSGAHLDRFKPDHAPGGTLSLVVGAIDNVEARQAIAGAISARLPYLSPRDKLVWLDAGNEQMSGQVILGNSLEPEPLLSPLGYCLGLPLPHLQEPTLIMKRPQRLAESCADLAQSLVINRAIASWVAVYLYRLLCRRDLDLSATWLNLSSGQTRSQPITSGRVVAPRLALRPPPDPPRTEPTNPVPTAGLSSSSVRTVWATSSSTSPAAPPATGASSCVPSVAMNLNAGVGSPRMF